MIMSKRISKIVLLILALYICLALDVKAQGFNWQYSSRMPSASPDDFLGINLYGGADQISGDFRFSEGMSYCDRYGNGSGISMGLGVNYEKWFRADMAYVVSGRWQRHTGEFSKESSVERDIDYILVTEYRLETSTDYLSLDGGIKYRLFETHFHVGGGLGMSYLLANTNDLKEVVISPRDKFIFANGSHERIMGEGSISDYHQFYMELYISVGYDLNMGLGKYMVPGLRIGLPVFMDNIKSDQWRRYSLALSISVYFGL